MAEERESKISGKLNPNYNHGHATGKLSPTYVSWKGLKQRCRQRRNYPSYADKNINFCDRWKSFDNFLLDMGERPNKEHSIGLIDNTKDYCPENCRWEAQAQQSNNTSKTVWVTLWGNKYAFTPACKMLGLIPSRVQDIKQHHKFTAEEAIIFTLKKYHGGREICQQYKKEDGFG